MSTEQPLFATDEILWYDNGKWGDCGYAIANPNGKIWTNNHVMAIFRREALRLMTPVGVRAIGGKYPAGFSGGEDLSFNRQLADAGYGMRGDLLPTNEMFYVYRWGTGSSHLSGVSDGSSRPHQAHWDALGQRPIEHGSFQILPQLRKRTRESMERTFALEPGLNLRDHDLLIQQINQAS